MNLTKAFFFFFYPIKLTTLVQDSHIDEVQKNGSRRTIIFILNRDPPSSTSGFFLFIPFQMSDEASLQLGVGSTGGPV